MERVNCAKVKDIFEEEEEEEEKLYPEYGAPEFWNESYERNKGSFDWYFGWEKLSKEIASSFLADDQCLVLGCGNSEMAADMLQSGFSRIVNIDLSAIVISQMREKYQNEVKLEWYEMDVTKMSFPNNSFDLIIDKGTIDAILCRMDGEELVEKAVSEIFRVLANSGRFVFISFGSPSQRLPVIKKIRRNWTCKPVVVIPPEPGDPKETQTYIYVFEKAKN
jgi:RAT1-interacting protein